MTDIALFYCNPWVRHGGHVTYTIHLMHALRAVGYMPTLFKIGKNTEHFTRPYGYGERYRNVAIKDAARIARRGLSLITAPSKPASENIDKLLKAGAPIVIHDPAEFEHGWDVKRAEQQRPIIIRKSMKKHVPNNTFIPHPYMPHFERMPPHKARKHAGITLSRIDWDKNTELVLDANRLLAKRDQVQLYGAENRLYTKFRVMPNYPEFVQGSTSDTNPRVFARELGVAAELAAESMAMVDMSVIKNDGGGTQYSFLEAMDGGAVCIIHEKWVLKNGVMQPGRNCLSASNGEEIAAHLRYSRTDAGKRLFRRLANEARAMFKTHDVKRVGRAYKRYFDNA